MSRGKRAQRDKAGRFARGQSGNPLGRPRGSVAPVTRFRQAIDAAGDALIARAVDLALAGDNEMLSLLVGRLVPQRRPTDDPIAVPTVRGESPAQLADRVIAEALAGRLPADVAERIVATLKSAADLRGPAGGAADDEARGRALREMRELLEHGRPDQ